MKYAIKIALSQFRCQFSVCLQDNSADELNQHITTVFEH